MKFDNYGCSTEFVRFAPTESISSINITHGARSFAASGNLNKKIGLCDKIQYFNN